MSIVQRSSAADKDLDDVWDYISQDSPNAAIKFLRNLDSKFRMLAENPLMGQNRDDLASALRCFSVGNYVIFFRPISDGIEVVRVLHGARDAKRSF
jgi:toxin ParE1/3/4